MSEASEPRMPNLLVDREYVVMKSDRGGMNGLIAEDWVTLYGSRGDRRGAGRAGGRRR